MSAAEAMGQLVCGSVAKAGGTDDFSRMMASIRSQLEDYMTFVLDFRNRPKDKQASYFLPLALRSVMEASCSGVLARIDPFRVVYAAKAQLSPAYERTAQQAASLKWSGDMVVSEKPKNSVQQPANDSGQAGNANSKASPKSTLTANWDPNLGRDKLPRAVFSLHMYEIIWNPSHKAFTDWFVDSNSSSQIFRDLAGLKSENVRDLFSLKGSQIYSELSKGIHPEFLIDRQIEFDGTTLVDMADRVMTWVLQMSTLSHFSPICNGRLDADEVTKLTGSLEQAIFS